MLVKALLEHDRKGKPVMRRYRRLYHITDYHGLAYSVSRNHLKSLRQSGVSMTTKEEIMDVGGRNHYHFKLVLDGQRLLDQYPAHYYRSFARTSDGGRHEWKESEVRVEADIIEPLRDYLIDLIIMIPLFSESFIQWMFYENITYTGFLDNSKSESPRVVSILRILVEDWGVPLSYQDRQRNTRALNEREWGLMRFCFDLDHEGLTYKQALERIADAYPELIDHDGDRLDGDTVRRRTVIPKIVRTLNRELGGKSVTEIDPKHTRRVIMGLLRDLGLGDNMLAQIMAELDREDLFHPVVEPVSWTGIFRPLIKHDFDQASMIIRFMGKEYRRKREAFPGYDTGEWQYGIPKRHVRTGMAGDDGS